MHGDMGFGLGFLNFLGTILFWVAVFWAVRFFVRGGFSKYRSHGRYPQWRRGWHGGGRPWEARSDEADKLVRERLARGEISEDEYARLKAQLGGNGSVGDNGGSRQGVGGGNARSEGGPLGWLRGDGALETARMRLAKGEISEGEFETIRRVLTS